MPYHPLRESARRAGRVVYLELVVLVLSLLSLGALTVELLLPLDPETLQLLRRMDDLICLVFLFDFGVHFWLAPSKVGFLKWGWIDFIPVPQGADMMMQLLAREREQGGGGNRCD
jgi:voltage-gated potassium channel